jgi:hypothetical protein
MLRVLTIGLLVLIVLAVVGDFVARALAERRLADTLQRELDLDREPSVGIDAFPFTVALVEGNIDTITIETNGVASDGIRLERTTLTFKDVEFSLGQLLSGDHRRVTFGSGRGTARLSDDDLTAALEESGTPAQVEFRNGAVFVSSDRLDGEVEGELAIDDGMLTILPASASQFDGIELPQLGGGVTYEDVELRGATAVLTLSIDSRTVEL